MSRVGACWFQRVKDKEFESNSQPRASILMSLVGWFQRVKDKEFESNSQPPLRSNISE